MTTLIVHKKVIKFKSAKTLKSQQLDKPLKTSLT